MRFLTRLFIILALCIAAATWTGAWLATPKTENAPAFVVAQGEGTGTIVANLKEQGVIRSALLFRRALSASGMAAKLQPGTYDLRPAKDFGTLIRILTTGGIPQNEFSLTVIEGWNLADIKKALDAAGFVGGDLYQVTGIPATDHRTLSAAGAPQPRDFSAEYAYLKDKPSYVSLEGFLFPDTYRFFKDATAEDVVAKLLGHFDEQLTPDLRLAIERQQKTVYDVITLASVVEREVRGDADRRKVADLFWRRLEIGMPLQADSTVNYATGKSLPSVSIEDTQNISRWNTYKYPGLPLGPISNPSLSAIEATVNPEPNDFWYFLTDDEGTVHYAKTFEQHVQNKNRYLR